MILKKQTVRTTTITGDKNAKFVHDSVIKADLEKFYQELTNELLLMQQFESITHRKEFIKLAVRLGAGRGYKFTASELEDAIEASTAAEQGEYFCLPIGCWHKAESA